MSGINGSELLERFGLVRDKAALVCGKCAFHYQHFRYDRKFGYQAVNCGHCLIGRIKKRTPMDKACVHFQHCENFETEDEIYEAVLQIKKDERALRAAKVRSGKPGQEPRSGRG